MSKGLERSGLVWPAVLQRLLFSTVAELTTLMSLRPHPSLHAAARQMPSLPVSLARLYDKVNHTEPAIQSSLTRQHIQRPFCLTEMRDG